ncbi:restriction endonuclease subunit S [Microtetraspora fusca]|uniref:Restriction endonuclease subunit S n=1 Tax=Microtetraspora fusca TaxID=1997 RepID=A0ABW6VG61_MICFU
MSNLPPGWARTTLGEIGLYLNGRGFKKTEWSDSGRPIIRIQNLTGSGNDFNYYAGDLEERHIVRSGDLLISWAASLGAFIWQGPEGALNQHIFKVDSFVDKRFHYYLVQHQLDELYRQTHGSGMVHVTKGRFDSLPVLLPPLEEQRRIVAALEDYLSRLDAGSGLLEDGERRSRTLKKALAAHAVQGLITKRSMDDGDGKDLLDKVMARRAALVRRRRATPAPPALGSALKIPLHWTTASMDQLCWDIEYGTSAKAHAGWTDGAIPVLRMGNIQEGAIVWNSLKYLPPDHPDSLTLKLADGDLLFNRTNSAELVGKSAVYRESMGPATFASYLIRCRLVDGVEPDWVNLVVNSFYGRSYVGSVVSQQVGQANVNGTKLAAMPIPLPPRGEQVRILAAVAEQNAGISRLDKVLKGASSRAGQLLRSLIVEAFNGRLVPQDPDDEPASVLLERIKSGRAAAPAPKRRGSRTGLKAGGTRSGSRMKSEGMPEQGTLI